MLTALYIVNTLRCAVLGTLLPRCCALSVVVSGMGPDGGLACYSRVEFCFVKKNLTHSASSEVLLEKHFRAVLPRSVLDGFFEAQLKVRAVLR